MHVYHMLLDSILLIGTKWLPPRGTCEDAEKNCEEKELPQPMNKKSEIQWKERCNEFSEALKTVTAAENPYANFATAVHPFVSPVL